MKNALLLFACIAFGKLTYGQQNKQSIDYQYHRDEKSYYAFELYKTDKSELDNQLLINFTANTTFKKIDKIILKSGETEFKLKFKLREEAVKSDNPEQKFYPIIFSGKDLETKKLDCNAQIVFKLDNNETYILPFSPCILAAFITKN